ncbi:poly(A)-binding protein binding protein [Dimargaris verticillata]|uniref:Poly(A)-binding protein binding protein n=1 Tax=Dimargaris verticillata TaxID=2761393 RepID=A0A9W8BBG6_9FUNG|nr:poly(A)-binding protein binding protein [Dimargaris verticillata]
MASVPGRSFRGRRGNQAGGQPAGSRGLGRWSQGNPVQPQPSARTLPTGPSRFQGQLPTPKASPSGPSTDAKASSPPQPDATPMHHRMLFLLAHLVGLQVEVHTKDGKRYVGLLHSATTEDDLGVVLKFAREITTSTHHVVRPLPSFIVLGKDCVSISATGVDFASLEKARDHEKLGFKTDTGISGHSGQLTERELRPWNPEEHTTPSAATKPDIFNVNNLEAMDWCEVDEPTVGLSGTTAPLSGLGDSGRNQGPWDQFAANEKLFGLRTDFNEEIYTTRLDRSRPDYKQREAEAIRLAQEIAQAPTSNLHVAEERGHAVTEDTVDEEDRYGAVIRDPRPGKYMPPALRRHWDGRPPASPPTRPVTDGHKRNSSSHLEHPQVPPMRGRMSSLDASLHAPPGLFRAHTTSAVPLAKEIIPGRESTSPASLAAVQEAPESTSVPVPVPAATPTPPTSRSKPKFKAPGPGGLAIDTKSPAVRKVAMDPEARQRASPLDIIGPKIAQQLAATSKAGGRPALTRNGDDSYGSTVPMSAVERSSKPIEHEIVGTFRQFVSTEKERLQHTKQAFLRKAKDGRVADLINFSKNFKLKTPMPADLARIVGKPSPAPAETAPASKAPAKSLASSKASAPTTAASVASASPPTSGATPTAMASAADSKLTSTPLASAGNFKLNINAMSFKPNPGATPFVPKPRSTSKPPATTSTHDSALLAFFGTRTVPRSGPSLNKLYEAAFRPCSAAPKPLTVGPTWPLGTKTFLQQFSAQSSAGHGGDLYESTMYSGPGGYGYAYGYGGPSYHRYPAMYGDGTMPPQGHAGGVPSTGAGGPLPPPHPSGMLLGMGMPMGVGPMPMPYLGGQAAGSPAYAGHPHPPPPYGPVPTSAPYGAPMLMTASAPGGMYAGSGPLPPAVSASQSMASRPFGKHHGPEDMAHGASGPGSYGSPRRSPAVHPQPMPGAGYGYPTMVGHNTARYSADLSSISSMGSPVTHPSSGPAMPPGSMHSGPPAYSTANGLPAMNPSHSHHGPVAVSAPYSPAMGAGYAMYPPHHYPSPYPGNQPTGYAKPHGPHGGPPPGPGYGHHYPTAYSPNPSARAHHHPPTAHPSDHPSPMVDH